MTLLNASFLNQIKRMVSETSLEDLEDMLKENRLEDLLWALEERLRNSPQNPLLLNLKGIALYQKGSPEEALQTFSQIKENLTDHPTVLSNFSYVLLSLGLFEEGWHYYEKRLQNPDQNFMIQNSPVWDGSPTEKLILLPEQGFGDIIQFIRFAPLLQDRVQKLILACPQEVMQVISQCFEPQGFEGFHQILNASGTPQNFDPFTPHVTLCSLPYHLKIDLMNLPNSIPYLYAPPEKIESWRGIIENHCQKEPLYETQPLRVGLAWAGRSTHSNNHNRSMDGAFLESLSDTPSVRWVSLQKDKATPLPSSLQALDVMEDCHDLVDTMALIHHLDLVITVDTSIAHLAGAMGKPTWLMLPFAAEWRWMKNFLFNPWYPTMVLFRQENPGDWESVLQKIKQQFSYIKPNPEINWEKEPHPQSSLGAHCFFWGKKAVMEGNPILGETLLAHAIGILPNLSFAHNILGIAYAYQKKSRAAAQEFLKASHLLPTYSSALMNFGMACLKLEVFDMGLSFYESRISTNLSNYMPPQKSRWNKEEKESLEGRNLLVYGEQGFGDHIQFGRFIPWIKPMGRAKNVKLLVRPPLVRLLSTLKNVDEVIPWDGHCAFISEAESYIEYMSVPHHLGGFPHNFLTPEIPYFEVKPEWQEPYKPFLHPHKLNIGLAWKVSATGSIPQDRCLDLHTLKSLFYIPRIQWTSLQVDEPEEAELMGLLNPSSLLHDFAETAGLISQLDLVITTDTSVAHLAGALGKPTWVLLSHSTPDWRWHPYSKGSRWYPTMRIFMQPTTREWGPVISQVYESLLKVLMTYE